MFSQLFISTVVEVLRPHSPGPMRQGLHRGGTASYGYYEEVRIISDECLSQSGTLIVLDLGYVGPGLRRMSLLGTWVNRSLTWSASTKPRL
jgi:hypothetical protein